MKTDLLEGEDFPHWRGEEMLDGKGGCLGERDMAAPMGCRHRCLGDAE